MRSTRTAFNRFLLLLIGLLALVAPAVTAPLASADPVTPTAIRLEGAKNFRDIGGYETSDGRTVRSGLVYRANKLSSLTDADLAKLTAANVTLDVDLRNMWERRDDPDRLPRASATRWRTSSRSNTASRSTSSCHSRWDVR